MNVQFVITQKTSSGSYHIAVDINGNDVGVLYLDENEERELSSAMRLRAAQGNFEFSIVDETLLDVE
jgi:hypothetical protein